MDHGSNVGFTMSNMFWIFLVLDGVNGCFYWATVEFLS